MTGQLYVQLGEISLSLLIILADVRTIPEPNAYFKHYSPLIEHTTDLLPILTVETISMQL